ncbi:MAG: site-2 protease family protein [Candidatus Zambryskibacteria bacterium]|nr:site-2 protease family protein [Candidatus Zambryskibacteria bacterium]
MSIIIFLIILSALVIVHELGHFLVARYFGIRVDEFGIGFPPRAKNLFVWKGTPFTLNWLPFGGFVKIFGENQVETQARPVEATGLACGESFQNKNRSIQAAVLAAGVVFNFLFAWILISLVYHSVFTGFADTVRFTVETFKALFHFSFKDVSGPVGIVGIVREATKLGASSLMMLTALISVNLSIINLIPVPALDGGRLVFVAIESITRRKIKPSVFNAFNTIGFALLIILMVAVTIQDMRNIF